MMQITEDTPPDMLAGAMDLTVHLPTGRTVKMSVERSTPMMDLLVQITTAHHLQHSGHILQALEMAPNSGHTDKILPYKPNTPIGALDTQHVKVIPKNRSVPVPKTVSVGHQPFESTFRLQVHLPRNQLYVIRVSQNVHLEDIMKKVCEEKNLDSVKYEFRHPGNLDEVLDPKLTLSDYQITEVYIVSKGTVGLTQAFSSSDIMALRKEEERKQLQARTGGGVFSLIFKRGKPSMGSGSLSSENRSISPSHSDDSRSVTPPAIQQQILPPVPQEPQTPTEKPKPPQRKRRPAPKPPQNADNRKDSTDKPPSQISNVSDSNTSDIQEKKIDNGLTICHSRNSSDSSGYHEPSVLSDNCNTSLPRRPKSTIINEVVSEEVQSGEHSRSNGNLSKMATFSKSTTSITSRKKKAAPPPPPVLKSESSITNSEKASPVVANPLVEKQDTDQNQSKTDTTVNEDTSFLDVAIKNSSSDNQIKTSPNPPPRNKVASAPPKPTPRVKPVVVENPVPQARNSKGLAQEDLRPNDEEEENTNQEPTNSNNQAEVISSTNNKLIEQFGMKPEETQLKSSANVALAEMYKSSDTLVPDDTNDLEKITPVSCNSSDISESGRKPPEIIAVIPKKTGSPTSLSSHKSSFDTIGRKRGFQIGTSMLSMNDIDDKRSISSTGSAHVESSDTSSQNSKNSNYASKPVDDYEVNDFNIDMFNSISKGSENSKKILHELHGIHDLDSEQEITKNRSLSSLRSSESMPSFLELSNIKKWKNLQELDHISVGSDTTSFGGSRWVVGDTSDTDSISTAQTKESPRASMSSSKRSSCVPSRQESRADDVLNKPTPTKDSPPASVASSKSPSRRDSTVDVVLDKPATPSKVSPRGSISSSKSSSRRDSRPDSVLDKPTTPSKESPRGSINSSQQESRSIIAPDNIVTTPPTKESPRGSLHSSCLSSRKESKSSTFAENIETETVAVIKTAPKIDQMESKRNLEITTKLAAPLPPPSGMVQKLCEARIDEGNSKTDGPGELAELESEWQYQLPSPPTAFRDSSPTNMTDVTNYDTITLQDFKAESVVTNPELFEKLRVVKESQCETETVSDFNSVVSDEENPMLNKLTLENLEKRKSLVYNRELSTSLKIAQENVSSSSNVNNNSVGGVSSKRSSMLSELEEVIHNAGSKSLMRHSSCVTEKTVKPVIDSNLPNFKISTYDKPKKKINIFEDDSIRSNVENAFKTNSSADLSENKDFSLDNKTAYSMEKQFSINKNSYMGRSMENISYRKNSIENQSDDDLFKKPHEFPKYKANTRTNFYVKHQADMSNSVMRSESFSSNHNVPVWKPQNPVQRSKSQVALNRYRDEQETRMENDDGLSKCNSLFDVSGLQSLEVMRMIQTKLNTPSNSTEQLLKEENSYKQTSARNSIIEEESSYNKQIGHRSSVGEDGSYKQTSSRNSIVELEGDYRSSSARNSISLESSSSTPSSKTEPESTTNTKTYRYQGPPAINLSTWSERPKTKVSLKEDTDYKINSKDNFNSKIKLNTSLSNGSIEIRHYSNNSGASLKKPEESNGVSIKVNGTEPIMTQESGNVVIKIGETQKAIDNFSTRFINHTTAAGYRKPLANINKIEKAPRPHSVAFDTDFDISRVPIVRAVELKKPFKETPTVNNTSVTQINSINNETTNKYADTYRSSESINEINGLKQTKNSSVYLSSDSVNKPVLRVNSFAQNRPGPVVMGFRGSEIGNDNTARSRKSWNVPNSYGTLPLKVNPEPPVKSNTFVPNSNVPFSQITLKRIESNKVLTTPENNVNNTNTVFGKVILRNTSSQIKGNNNHRFSTGSPFGAGHNFESNRRYSNGVDSTEAPPPPPLMPKVTSVTKKVVKSPESSLDSRDELLHSIRNFGGMKGLRNVKA